MANLRPRDNAEDKCPPPGLPVRWAVIGIIVMAACVCAVFAGGGVVATISVGAAVATAAHALLGH